MVMNIIAAVLTLLAVAGSIFAYKLEKSDYKKADSDYGKRRRNRPFSDDYTDGHAYGQDYNTGNSQKNGEFCSNLQRRNI